MNLLVTVTPRNITRSCWPTLGLQQFTKISSSIILLAHMVYSVFCLR